MLEAPFDVEKLLKRAEHLGAGEVEVELIVSRRLQVEARADTLARAVTQSTALLGVRATIGKRIGSAGGEVSSLEEALQILEAAVKNAKSSPEDPSWPGFNPKTGKAGASPSMYHEETASAGPERLSNILTQVIGEARKAGASVAEATIYVGESLTVYANSYGGPLMEAYTGALFSLEVKKRRDQKEATYYDGTYWGLLSTERIETVTGRALKRVEDALDAVRIEPFRGVLVLSPQEASSFLDALIVPAVSGENIVRRRSPLTGRIGEKVLHEDITLVDDPFHDWAADTRLFDDEGHPTSRKAFIESGVFKTPLYDHYSAHQAGKESTGNGFRRRPWSTPSPAPTNVIVEPRNVKPSLDSLISTIDKGLMLVSSIGAWLSNPVSGQINATTSLGYLIEKGSIVRPVKGLVIGGNIYKALGEAYHGAGGKQECDGSYCSPWLALGEISYA